MKRLGVFAKYWQAGQVKTRLATTLGKHRAAAVYFACLRATLDRCADLNIDRAIVFAPAERRAEFQQLAGDPWRTLPQADGDLGTRMRQFLDVSFDSGFDQVVIIGTDSPTLPPVRFSEAFEALQSSSVVLGPSADGGYYLLGVRSSTPDVFDGVPWGTSSVLRQTVDHLQRQSTSFELLEPWYDVDDADSFLQLRNELADCRDDPVLVALRDRIEAAQQLDPDSEFSSSAT